MKGLQDALCERLFCQAAILLLLVVDRRRVVTQRCWRGQEMKCKTGVKVM